MTKGEGHDVAVNNDDGATIKSLYNTKVKKLFDPTGPTIRPAGISEVIA